MLEATSIRSSSTDALPNFSKFVVNTTPKISQNARTPRKQPMNWSTNPGSLLPRFPSSSSRPIRSSNARRPLRSSPLAGPALRHHGSSIAEPEVEEKEEKLKPSGASSMPDLALFRSPSSLELTSRGASESHGIHPPPPSNSSTSSTEFLSPPPHTFVSGSPTKNTRPISRAQSTSSASSPTWTLRHLPSAVDKPTDRTLHLQSPPLDTQQLNSAHGYPTVLHRSSTYSGAPDHLPRAHTARDRPMNNDWLTVNPYEITPKFTRLGLGSSGVVLPVSVKEYKRLARQNSTNSVGASSARAVRVDSLQVPDAGIASPKQARGTLNVPTQTLAVQSKSTSSSESLLSPSSPPAPRGGQTSSVITSTPVITTIAEADESDHHLTAAERESPPSKLLHHLHPYSSPPPTTTAPKKAPLLLLARMKSLGTRSKDNFRTWRTPTSDSSSSSSPDPSTISRATTAKKDKSPSPASKVGFAAAEVLEVPKPTRSKSTSIKQFWKSVIVWQR